MKFSLRSKLPHLFVGTVTVLALTSTALLAQDDAAAPAEGQTQTLWDLIAAGGWAMWPLGLFSVCMITLAVYNFMQLTRKKFVPPLLKQSVLSHMAEVRVRSSIEEAAESASYLGRMLATALPHVDATEPETLGRDKVEDAVADFAVKENPAYMSWVG
ncbi:MAG: MotA/TolQ/ExbB proton channel family protein, partial [Verrucomicrobiae bacterium]|nr:MotA/TolQ/ExbB proton channel family protein [Verrucomicrobiae bacterium]